MSSIISKACLLASVQTYFVVATQTISGSCQLQGVLNYSCFVCLQVWAFAKLLPSGQPLFGPPQALLNAVPKHVVRQLADDSQHHKVAVPA